LKNRREKKIELAGGLIIVCNLPSEAEQTIHKDKRRQAVQILPQAKQIKNL
jgi:tellurite resistance protein